jgi:hypothetical protein
MKHFIPDQELLWEVFGAYIDRGMRFEVMTELFAEGYNILKVQLSEGSTIAPLLPLPAAQMQTPEAARQWLEYLRDEQLVMFTRGMVG